MAMNTARIYLLSSKRVAKITLAVSVITVAALVLAKSSWAASGNTQICSPSSSCTIGEFIYDDTYTAHNSATCQITSRYPDGTLYLNAQAMTHASENDGWYYYTFTAPSTTGLYRTEVRCTVDGQVMALDKSFEVKAEASSASDVASATWGYSSRTLTSFSSLITDMWNNTTRTLTGASLSSGSIATKADVDAISTKVDTVSSDVSTIKTESLVTIQQLANGPIIEQTLEADSDELSTKIEKSQKYASQLNQNASYISSKVGLINSKWGSLKKDKVGSMLASINSPTKSILGASTSLYEMWGWKEANTIVSQAKSIEITIKSIQKNLKKQGKSELVRRDLKTLSNSLEKLKISVGNARASNSAKNILGKVSEASFLLSSFDKGYTKINKVLLSYDKSEKSKVANSANKLSKEILAINRIPELDLEIARTVVKKDTDQVLKNKLLGLIGVVRANKKLLATNSNQTASSTWLELGSIVFKTVVTNPSSSISQTVPVKYYLPKEVKRKDVIEADEDIKIEYDSEKDQYYISGVFTLSPNESITISVRVDDKVFEISKDEIEDLKKQAKELSEPLKNTSYFAQGVTLKSDIDASLNKVIVLTEDNITPEDKIRSYREAKIELDEAKIKMEKLKELVSNAGSVGTFFGFVGGAQTLAVWGMIVIMVAGFVFLTLYMRSIRINDLALQKAQFQAMSENEISGGKTKKGKKKMEEPELQSEDTPKPKKRIRNVVTLGLMVVGLFGVIGVLAMGIGSFKNNKDNSAPSLAMAKKAPVKKAVLAETDEALVKNGTQVEIFVPEDTTVTVHKDPKVSSPIILTLDESIEALKLKEDGIWVQVRISDEKEKITGWVDRDFVEEIVNDAVEDEEVSLDEEVRKVKVLEDLDNYLKVREEKVDGKIIGKAYAGDTLTVISESEGWLKVEFDNETQGWVSAEFVTDL